MKFNVSSTELLERVQTLSRVIASKNTLAIAGDILFSIHNGELTLTASDLETTLVTKLPVSECDGDGSVTIDTKRLIESLREFADQPLEFNVNNDNFQVQIRTVSGNYNLGGHNGEEYPPLKVVEQPEAQLSIKAQTLENAISKTIFAAPEDKLRPAMSGIFVDMTAEGINFVATDAHKLVRYRVTNTSCPTDKSFIIARKPAILLQALLQKEEGDVTIEYDEKEMVFAIEKYTMYSRQVEGKYPNYDAVIPKGNPFKLSVDRLGAIAMLRRMSLFSNEASNMVRFDISSDLLKCSAQDYDNSASAEEKMPCQYQGDPLSIGFKAGFLIDILKNIESDNVVFQLANPSRAGVIVPEFNKEGEDVLMLLMPMILND